MEICSNAWPPIWTAATGSLTKTVLSKVWALVLTLRQEKSSHQQSARNSAGDSKFLVVITGCSTQSTWPASSLTPNKGLARESPDLAIPRWLSVGREKDQQLHHKQLKDQQLHHNQLKDQHLHHKHLKTNNCITLGTNKYTIKNWKINNYTIKINWRTNNYTINNWRINKCPIKINWRTNECTINNWRPTIAPLTTEGPTIAPLTTKGPTTAP